MGITIIEKMGNTVALCDNEITTTKVVEEDGFINGSGYTLTKAGTQGFSGLTGIAILNTTDGKIIHANNYTMSSTGLLKNTTTSPIVWSTVKINYTYTWTDNHSWNETQQKCVNVTNGDPITATGAAYTGMAYANTQLGTSGILSWLPAIIALLVGIFFLIYFMGGKKKY